MSVIAIGFSIHPEPHYDNFVNTSANLACTRHPYKTAVIISILYALAWSCLQATNRDQLSLKMKRFIPFIGLLNSLGGSFLLQKLINKWKYIPFNLLFSRFPCKIVSPIQIVMQPSYKPLKLYKGSRLIAEIKNDSHSQGCRQVTSLYLHTEDPFDMGFSQGFLLGDRIEDLFIRVFKPILENLGGAKHCSEKLLERINNLYMQTDYLWEMKGMVKGIQYHALKANFETQITEEDIIAMHIIDIYKKVETKFCPSGFLSNAIMVKKGEEILLAHILDSQEFSELGQHFFLKKYTYKKTKVCLLNFPGFCGVLSGSNSHGLKLAVNELGNYTGLGTPHCFLAREILEKYSTTDEILDDIQGGSYPYASSHHLIMMDKKTGYDIAFIDEASVYLSGPIEEGDLISTNHGIDDQNQVVTGSEGDLTSVARHKKMSDVLKNTKMTKGDVSLHDLAKKVIASVNTFTTVSVSIYSNNNDDIHAFDNCFAGMHI